MNARPQPAANPLQLPGPEDPYQRPDEDRLLRLPGEQPGEPGIQLRVRSLRRLRRTIVLSIWGFTLGALLIVFQSPQRNEFLAPGRLTSQHAQILAGMGGDRCAACHDAGNRSWLSWTGGLWGNSANCPTSQSELCLNCHRQTIEPALAANPHSLDLAQLAPLTARREEKFRLAGMELPGEHPTRQLACAACHLEHRGAEASLTAVSDKQCQTCHAQRHRSFEQGHPEFQLVGTELPSLIKFDHQTHLKQYFPAGQQEFSCAQCHVGDSQRNVMKLTSYETMCSSCHEQTIRTTGQQGLVLLELPSLDLEKMRELGVDPGSWPSGAQGDFAGRLHPLTWTLLARDETLVETLQAFPAGYDFGEIDPENETQMRQLGTLAKGLKQLLLDLATKDFTELTELARSGPGSLFSSDSSHQVFRDAIAAWFPEMAASGRWAVEEQGVGRQGEPLWIPPSRTLARWLQEQELLVPNPLAGKVSPVSPQPETIRQAEPPQAVRAAQATANAGSSRQVTSGLGITNRPDPVDDKGGQGGFKTLPALRERQESLPPANPSESSEWLARNPLQEHFRQSDPQEGPSQDSKLAQQTDSINNLELQRNTNAPPHKAAVHQPSQAPAIEPVFSLPVPNLLPQAALAQGWRRDDRTYRLVYHVAEHADPFWPRLAQWLEHLQRANVNPSADVLGQWLRQPGTAGDCFSCHRTGELSPFRNQVGPQWTSELRAADPQGFTRFNHAPHLLQLQCADCHQMVEPKDAAPAGQLVSWPGRAASDSGPISQRALSAGGDFAAIERSTCVQCHRQNQAPNTCTTCHQYHVSQAEREPQSNR